MYALYARQSIEKKDSISVESQIEYCKYETHGDQYKEYIDRGYSGKNTNRPAFEEMIIDIEQGKISKVVVYKLDRISRSILDFSNLMEMFQKYQVEFISTTEKFDTSTPIGRAMLNICIVFAQLERETIQKRVIDAYYSRSKRGFYMGGRVPYGFNVENTVIDGIKTSQYAQIPEECEQIKLLYAMYSDKKNSLGDILRYLNKNSIKNLRGAAWCTARISEMLRNPVYVRADADVYTFFKSQGTNIYNNISDFTGYNGCYLYKGTISSTRKQCDLTNKELVLAPHEGVVSSNVWLKCRMRFLQNRQATIDSKAKNSWLVGKVKCGKCGYALTIKKSNTKWERYFVCSGKATLKNCNGTGKTVYAKLLEEYMLEAIKQKLTEFNVLTEQDRGELNPKINEDKIKLTNVENEINSLLEKVIGANDTLMGYINERIEKLDEERKRLQEEILSFSFNSEDNSVQAISNHIEKWEELTFEDKRIVVDSLIKIIYIEDDNIDITWNF
ncbi:recombinase family protein [Anaeromicropila herbilytica]|uniref:Serine recombinase n=1 Tax=Anaeromicropila herbilytica TaxID=2785025 RepID=A0A7R7EIZ5_9FIRM|nr:recombinase family protein [Anaeromicropila herbilytica]BCN29594.1 serine recombinase [Anaeromicropila herbilytica]